ncbi:MAG: hypothetical protein EOP62_14230 [Sphingomonadales bacterium]|nr:MAG: hypothetical protein EOP62_14230 [Sphingomonadales bacterium]
MAKRRPSVPPGQFAFTFDVPTAAREPSALSGLDREVAATVALILWEARPKTRFEIAGAISELLDDDVTKSMLDKYASEGSEAHAISAARLLALVAATDRHDLLDRLTRRIGAALLVGEEILTAEIGDLDRQIAALKRRRSEKATVAPIIAFGRRRT